MKRADKLPAIVESKVARRRCASQLLPTARRMPAFLAKCPGLKAGIHTIVAFQLGGLKDFYRHLESDLPTVNYLSFRRSRRHILGTMSASRDQVQQLVFGKWLL